MEEKGLIWIAIVLGVILVISNLFMFGSIANNKEAIENQEVKVNVDFTDTNTKISDLETAFNELRIEIAAENNSTTGDYMLNKGEYEDEMSEEKAIELATEYLEESDFLEELADYLNNLPELSGVDEDDLSIEILDSDVKVITGDDYSVTFDLKVYEDEDKLAKIKNIKIRINDVDFDDGFEDAEVSEGSYYFNWVDSDEIRIY